MRQQKKGGFFRKCLPPPSTPKSAWQSLLFCCLETEFTTTAPALTRYEERRDMDPFRRESKPSGLIEHLNSATIQLGMEFRRSLGRIEMKNQKSRMLISGTCCAKSAALVRSCSWSSRRLCGQLDVPCCAESKTRTAVLARRVFLGPAAGKEQASP